MAGAVANAALGLLQNKYGKREKVSHKKGNRNILVAALDIKSLTIEKSCMVTITIFCCYFPSNNADRKIFIFRHEIITYLVLK